MRRMMFSLGIALLTAACNGNLTGTSTHVLDNPATDTQASVSAHNVSITASLGGHGPLGDSVTIHIHNDGPDTAYIPRCGSGPLLLVQTFMNGQWTGGVQNFMCLAPSAPGPVQLAPGASLDEVRVYRRALSAGEVKVLAAGTACP